MRPTVPTELPDWGFIIDLDPEKDARIHVIRVRAEKVLKARGITDPLIEDIATIGVYINNWGEKVFGAKIFLTFYRDNKAPAVDDLDRIKLLVHTAVTAICQAEMLTQFEEEDDESDWPQMYTMALARRLLITAVNAIDLAHNSAKASEKERIW